MVILIRLIALAAFIAVLTGCVINQYPDITVYFDDTNTDSIYAYNLKTQEKKLLVHGFGVQMSHKKDRLLYSDIEMQANFILTASSGIYTCDLTTQKSFPISPLKPDDDPIMILNWSPDDKYIVLVGGETDNGFSVLDSITGKEIAHAGMHEMEFAWLNADEAIFSERQDNVYQGRHSYGAPYGITIMNVTNNQKRILKEASDTASYYFQELTTDNKIVLSSISFIAITNDKGQIEYPITYWLMDSIGTVLKELPDYQPVYLQERNGNLPQSIKKKLPKPYDKYAEMYIKPLSGNWVILTGRNKNPSWEFFLMDKTNPHSLRKIGEGSSILW